MTNGMVAVLLRRWRLTLACVLVGAVMATVLAFVTMPAYSATVQLFVVSSGVTPTDRLQNAEYARSRMTSYVSLVNNPAVLDDLRERLRLRAGAPIADNITASSPLDSAVISVTATDSSPQRAQDVARAIGPALNSVVTHLETSSEGGGSPVQITAVHDPIRPTQADSPNRKLYALMGLIAGLGLGAALSVLLEWFSEARSKHRPTAKADTGQALNGHAIQTRTSARV